MTIINNPIPLASTDLHIYLIDDHDFRWWYIATSQNAALEHFVRDNSGGSVADFLKDCPDTTVTLIADDYMLTVYGVDKPGGEEERTITCAEWIKEFGDGECIATNADM